MIHCKPSYSKEADHGRDSRPSPHPTTAFSDATAVVDAGGVADSAGIAHPRAVAGPGRITTNGDGEMMISGGVRERSSGSAVPAGATDLRKQGAPSAEGASAEGPRLPFAGYDRLDEKQLKQGLSRTFADRARGRR